MAQLTAPHSKQRLGPGFWQLAIVLTIVNIAISWWIVTLDIDKYLSEAGAPAGDIDWLFKFMSVVANAIFVYVTGYIIYFSIVWRRTKNDPLDAVGIQIHDDHNLELWWTIIPAILVVILAVFSVNIWLKLQNTPGDVLTMESIGHQFKYEFRYASLKQSVYDEMHLPVGEPVTLHVTSADVIHSFWVPEMRVKYDMVPGLIQTLRFTPEKVGEYRVICTEFCGVSHANMAAKVYIDSKADFDSWIGKQSKLQAAGPPPVDVTIGQAGAGQQVFEQKCTACHSIGAFTDKKVGPGLGKLLSDPDHPKLVTGEVPNAVDISHILIKGYSGPDNSQGKNGPTLGAMPDRAANGLSNTDIANLSAYLVSLSKK